MNFLSVELKMHTLSFIEASKLLRQIQITTSARSGQMTKKLEKPLDSLINIKCEYSALYKIVFWLL